jgi:ribose transport system ATP-binding protein
MILIAGGINLHENIALKIKNMTKSFPGVKALDNISLELEKGEVHAIVGENGAGKSTLIKCISGAIPPDTGSMTIGNKTYNTMEPQLAKEIGIEVIYQEFNLIDTLSVAENVFLCQKTSKGIIVNTRERQKMAAEIFKKFNISIDPAKPVRELSPAYQQIVEIAKAIQRNVKILIMDEPTAPLTVSEVDMLFDIVRNMKKKGVTIIYISHRLEELFEIADRVTVMRDGAYIGTRLIKDTDRKELISMMAGRTLNETYPARKIKTGEEVLRVEDLNGNGVENISFNLHRGEVLGFAGLVGAGRSELMQVIYGAQPISRGNIYINGKLTQIKSPRDAIRKEIGYIPEDRKGHGLFIGKAVQWNIVINAIRDMTRNRFLIDGKKIKKTAVHYRDKLDIKASSLHQIAATLSGGNQQKTVIAKTLAAKTQILIFDEPTRGIDVGAKQEIYRLINELAEAGHSIMLVSSEMPELLGMSDRIIVIAEGRQMGILSRAEDQFDQHIILDLASGCGN